jgi:hypothetical protein
MKADSLADSSSSVIHKDGVASTAVVVIASGRRSAIGDRTRSGETIDEGCGALCVERHALASVAVVVVGTVFAGNALWFAL